VLAILPVDTEALTTELTRALAVAGVPEPLVTVCTCEGLDRRVDSGKIQRFVPLGSLSNQVGRTRDEHSGRTVDAKHGSSRSRA